jgi:hypothetical protein
MPIYDHDGTTSRELNYLADHNGTTATEWNEVYDCDGTTERLIFVSEEQIYPGQFMSAGPTINGAWYMETSGNHIKVAGPDTEPIGRSTYGCILTDTLISCAGYNRLEIHANISRDYSTSGYYGGKAGLFSARSAASTVLVQESIMGLSYYTLDISNYQGSYYIGARVGGGYYGNGSARIHSIRLYNA